MQRTSPSAKPIGYLEGTTLLVFALCVVAVCLAGYFFLPTMSGLIDEWKIPEYSYCSLVAVTALGWLAKAYPRSLQRSPSTLLGLSLVATSIVINLFGSMAANNWLSQYSLVVAAAGVVISISGRQIFYELIPAIFFLSFTIPLPPLLLAQLTSGLQLLSSTLSVDGLQLLSIPVYQEGNIIDLGEVKLQVAEACSGLRYIFPLISFSYVFSFVFETRAVPRLVLIFMAVPVAVFMNALRIFLIGLSVHAWGTTLTTGFPHELEGLIVFAGCLAVLWLIRFLGFRETHSSLPVEPTTQKSRAVQQTALPVILLGIVALFLLGMSLQAFTKSKQEQSNLPRTTLANFPLNFSGWNGHAEILPSDEEYALKLSDYLLAEFHRTFGDASVVNFYIAYYASQQRNAAPHSPLVCINGSGWRISKYEENFTVSGVNGQELLKVNRAVIQNGQEEDLVYFWYRERGRDLTSSIARKWYLFRDSLADGRTDGALMRVVTRVDPSQPIDAPDKTLSAFLSSALPLTNSYFPR